MLPLIAALLFALFGIAALAIDLGVAGASRLELENAADALVLGAPADRLFADETERAADAAARGVALALEPPRALSEPDGRRGFERRVPLFFGHGSLLAFAGSDAGEEILRRRRAGEAFPELADGGLRERGMPAAAERVLRSPRAEPAIRVGVAHGAWPGRADLAVAASCWSPAVARLVFAPPQAAGGAFALVETAPPEAALDPACPRAAAARALAPGQAVQWIGDRVGVELATGDTPSAAELAYVPLFVPETGRVIAFGRARIAAAAGGLWALEPQQGETAPNASALRASATADAARDARLGAAFAERAAFGAAHPDAAAAWLRAPVLAERWP